MSVTTETGLVEIRWHARAGQGAKTAAQLLALALLRSGRSVQAFPEYGPERRGAPLRAYTRVSPLPIRRHDSIEEPDLVVVLEPSLLGEVDVLEGLAPDGILLLNGEAPPPELADCADVRCVPATRIAHEHGSSFANVVMTGAVAALLREPPLEELQTAAAELLAAKGGAASVREAIAEGHAWLR